MAGPWWMLSGLGILRRPLSPCRVSRVEEEYDNRVGLWRSYYTRFVEPVPRWVEAALALGLGLFYLTGGAARLVGLVISVPATTVAGRYVKRGGSRRPRWRDL
jgi:hypothetical protein